MPQTDLIQIRDLTRREVKSGRLLLDKVNLLVHTGQRIGLIGPTGSGKSTLLRAVAKLDRCESGDVLYRGDPIVKDDVPGYRRQVIYLPQRPAFAVASVRENLLRPFQFTASKGRLDESQVVEWLRGLGRSRDMLDQSVERLSGGEQQIIALVRAMALSPAALLLDEPTASLDAGTTEQFEGLVMSWYNDDSVGRSFVWTSHDVDQVQRMTTRTVQIHAGVLTEESTDE